MEGAKKLFGVYLILVATIVAVWFIINTFFVNSFSVSDVWFVLDILMAIGLVIALACNFDRKRNLEGRSPDEPISRRYLEVNTAFYLTAGITILFFHNWFLSYITVRAASTATIRRGLSGPSWTPCCP